MYRTIRESLHRQSKALDLLTELQQEEYSYLKNREPQEVTATEMHIHELLRQIAAERSELKELLGKERLRDFIGRLMALGGERAERGETLQTLWNEVDAKEQRCARQAERNSQFAFALLDQSRSMLQFLHERIVPKKNDTYSKRGRMATERPQAHLIRGRL